MRKLIIAAASLAVIAFSSTAFTQQPAGTAAEAKAMLLKAVAAVKADKMKALDMFAKGEGGFLDRDLYVFCFNAGDGNVHPFANQNAKQFFGKDVRTQKDLIARPSDPKPVGKVSFVTRVADLGCGVGYYK
jgi:hypothetical protein